MGSNLSFRERTSKDGFILEINENRVVSFKLDKETYEWLENNWKKQGFSSRSQFLRYLINMVLQGKAPLNKNDSENIILMSDSHKTVTFKLNSSLLDKLDRVAFEFGYTSRSDLLRVVLSSLKESYNRNK